MRLSLTDLVRETGVPKRTIRHYVSARVLPPGAGGPDGGYDLGHVRVLRAIPRLKAEGTRSLEALRVRLRYITAAELADYSGMPLESDAEAPTPLAVPGAPDVAQTERVAAPPHPVDRETPPDAAHFRRLEAMYLAAPVNAIYRPGIVVQDGRSEITTLARAELHHAAGGVHGSVLFKMLDDAAFFAFASTVTDVFVLTASFHVSFLRPVVEGPMRAVGRVVRASRTLGVAEAVVYGPDGREAARGVGDFVRSRLGLAGLV